jgi:PIN domain nuclease of toxin-antitoxin system
LGSEHVLDASALIALFYGEAGEQQVRSLLERGAASAINISEVVGKLVRDGEQPGQARHAISALHLEIVPFDDESAYEAGCMIALTKAEGLSLGDRACLALARMRKLPAFTADARWIKIKSLGVDVRLIR